jgi:hypothetical protein
MLVLRGIIYMMEGSMKSLRLIALVGLSLVAVSVTAATVKVVNGSSNAIFVKPEWKAEANCAACSGPCYARLMPGASKDYNSEFYNVTSVRWMQEYPKTSILPDPTSMVVKIFATNVDIPLAVLGAEFTILNDGSYTFKRNFADLNKQSGTAQVANSL